MQSTVSASYVDDYNKRMYNLADGSGVEVYIQHKPYVSAYSANAIIYNYHRYTCPTFTLTKNLFFFIIRLHIFSTRISTTNPNLSTHLCES